MKTSAILATLFAITMSASARIGETREECIARYGRPLVAEMNGVLAFSKSGFQISIQFHQGKAEVIQVQKEAVDALGKPLAMSAVEIETVLAANGAGKPWHTVSGAISDQDWETEGATLSAGYSGFEKRLLIVTREACERASAEAAAEQVENLKGF